jgi:hypothetical protein
MWLASAVGNGWRGRSGGKRQPLPGTVRAPHPRNAAGVCSDLLPALVWPDWLDASGVPDGYTFALGWLYRHAALGYLLDVFLLSLGGRMFPPGAHYGQRCGMSGQQWSFSQHAGHVEWHVRGPESVDYR